MGYGTYRRSDLTNSMKLFKRVAPAEYAIVVSNVNKRKPANSMDAVDTLKERFEAKYTEIRLEDRWLFIGLGFKLIYPEAYREDVKDFAFTDGFTKKMSEALGMQPPNFSEAFKAVRVQLCLRDSELRKIVDETFNILGYQPCQTTLFDM